MKKIWISVLLLSALLLQGLAWAGDKEELQNRLAKINGFSAHFSQIVKTADNKLVQQGSGELYLSRPYYFNWQMSQPDPMSIVSDGKTVWVYTPDLAQVTASNLRDVANNDLLLLLTNNQSAVWQRYQVTRNSDTFSLQPTRKGGQRFTISVLKNGMITAFSTIENDGQHSDYQLSAQRLGAVSQAKFHFSVPAGVTVDDQRR